MAITYIDFYAENPIENKTIADSCIFENINGDGNALWTIYNSNDITITAEDTLYLNADRMWFNSSVEWTTIVSNSGMGFTTNPNSSGYSFTWNGNGGIWDVDTKGGDVRFNTYNSTSATYGTMVFPPVDKLQIAGGTNGQVLTTNGSGVLSWSTVGGGVSDGDKGDITVSGSGSVWTIDNSVVTYGKMQNASGHSVLGRSANTSGAIGEITSTANGEVLHRNGSNLVFGTIGDSSITASSISYSRLQDVSTNNRLLGRSTAGAGSIEEITVGSGLTLSAGTLSASGGGGAVYDVQTFTSSGTWTKPAGALWVEIFVIGAGSGGGAGRRGSASPATNRCGGAGGGGNTWVCYRASASALNATATVTIGAGGLGASAVTTDNTNGGNGNNGGTTKFISGSFRTNYPTNFSFVSGGGTSSTSQPGELSGSAMPWGMYLGYDKNFSTFSPAPGSGTTTTGTGTNAYISNYGIVTGSNLTGGGGGGTSSSGAGTEANGGTSYINLSGTEFTQPTAQGGIASGSRNGSNAASNMNWVLPASTGGGGGAYKPGATGGNGGNGIYGSGGGGGGASDNGFNSGAGGNGGDGCIVVISYG